MCGGLHLNCLTAEAFFQPGDKIEIGNFSSVQEHLCQQKWDLSHAKNNVFATKDVSAVTVENVEKVLNVHVGKTGGSTVSAVMSKFGVHYQSLHLSRLTLDIIRRFDIFIVNLRDPVQRLISSYYFEHPDIKGNYYDMQPNRRIPRAQNYFYNCNPTIDVYAYNLLESRKMCGNIARHGQHHTWWDMCAYMGSKEVLDALVEKKRNVYLISTESLVQDINAVSDLLHWNANVTEESLPHVQSYDSKPTDISLTAHGKLLAYLDTIGEMSLYNFLIKEFHR